MSQTAIAAEIARLEPWFHNLHLPDGTQTAPDHFLGDFPRFKWTEIAPHVPHDLTGWSVLDVGCNAGFYSIELARRGANVLGIDHDEHYLRQARWAAERFGLTERIEWRHMEVYDLMRFEPHRRFDLIWFMGVLYHLRYPLLALDLVADRVTKLLMFQTLTMPMPTRGPHNGPPPSGDQAGQSAPLDVPDDMHIPDDMDIHDRGRMIDPRYPKMAFIEHRLAGDPTNWWAPNEGCIQAMLRSANLRVVATPTDETYLCQPAQGQRAPGRWARPSHQAP